eukprot:TRINITY_DN34312_c0_g2_i3.p1 TRINITY_DN34312_c0_g2~~TRINITY_DN34312_c0_g2_i3.p1  ORF type:complete len:660 (-),score=146.82 TRINITY_DN34312_c0_g2_i3:285-2264(-)
MAFTARTRPPTHSSCGLGAPSRQTSGNPQSLRSSRRRSSRGHGSNGVCVRRRSSWVEETTESWGGGTPDLLLLPPTLPLLPQPALVSHDRGPKARHWWQQKLSWGRQLSPAKDVLQPPRSAPGGKRPQLQTSHLPPARVAMALPDDDSDDDRDGLFAPPPLLCQLDSQRGPKQGQSPARAGQGNSGFLPGALMHYLLARGAGLAPLSLPAAPGDVVRDAEAQQRRTNTADAEQKDERDSDSDDDDSTGSDVESSSSPRRKTVAFLGKEGEAPKSEAKNRTSSKRGKSRKKTGRGTAAPDTLLEQIKKTKALQDAASAASSSGPSEVVTGRSDQALRNANRSNGASAVTRCESFESDCSFEGTVRREKTQPALSAGGDAAADAIGRGSAAKESEQQPREPVRSRTAPLKAVTTHRDAAASSSTGANVASKQQRYRPEDDASGQAPGGYFLGSRRKSSRIEFRDEVQYLVRIARKHHLTIPEVRQSRQEFKELDTDGDGCLGLEEFLGVVQKRLKLPENQPIPDFLLARLSTSRPGLVNFEEYVVWCRSVAYEESLLVVDPKERQLRQLARDKGYLLPDVEKVKEVFDKFDSDKSDAIDEEEFGHAIRVLLKVRNPADISEGKLKRFWREVDCDGSGEICFEEFLSWYFRFMTTQDVHIIT